MLQESNYDDLALQPGEDREFKNQFTEFLKKNMPVDEPVKKKTTKIDASKIKFDRDKGVLEQAPDFDPLRTY